MTCYERAHSTADPGDDEAFRLAFVLAAQEHCDHYLTPIADPRGKSVLVVGAGAGSVMLWCLRHGASEVVGIDVREQNPAALRAAIAELGLHDAGRWSMHVVPAARAAELGRRFELVLSNNVFEHVRDIHAAFAACARLLEPNRGRFAIFTAPLYYSSEGAHLPSEPWEHLWGDLTALRSRLVAAGIAPSGLATADAATYLDETLSLNRMRLGELLRAAQDAGLTLLHLGIEPDRHLRQLPAVLDRLVKACPDVVPGDFAVAGVAAELALFAPGEPLSGDVRPTAQRVREADRISLETEIALHRAVLASVNASWAYRIGRFLTAPVRALRGGDRPAPTPKLGTSPARKPLR